MLFLAQRMLSTDNVVFSSEDVEYRYSKLCKVQVAALQPYFCSILPLITNEMGPYMYKSYMKNALYLAAEAKQSWANIIFCPYLLM